MSDNNLFSGDTSSIKSYNKVNPSNDRLAKLRRLHLMYDKPQQPPDRLEKLKNWSKTPTQRLEQAYQKIETNYNNLYEQVSEDPRITQDIIDQVKKLGTRADKLISLATGNSETEEVLSNLRQIDEQITDMTQYIREQLKDQKHNDGTLRQDHESSQCLPLKRFRTDIPHRSWDVTASHVEFRAAVRLLERHKDYLLSEQQKQLENLITAGNEAYNKADGGPFRTPLGTPYRQEGQSNLEQMLKEINALLDEIRDPQGKILSSQEIQKKREQQLKAIEDSINARLPEMRKLFDSIPDKPDGNRLLDIHDTWSKKADDTNLSLRERDEAVKHMENITTELLKQKFSAMIKTIELPENAQEIEKTSGSFKGSGKILETLQQHKLLEETKEIVSRFDALKGIEANLRKYYQWLIKNDYTILDNNERQNVRTQYNQAYIQGRRALTMATSLLDDVSFSQQTLTALYFDKNDALSSKPEASSQQKHDYCHYKATLDEHVKTLQTLQQEVMNATYSTDQIEVAEEKDTSENS